MRRIVLWMLLTMVVQSIGAQEVSEQQALQRAQNFLKQRGQQTKEIKTLQTSEVGRRSAGTNDYYVFNIGSDEGFVIVSGDERTEDILGYADKGSISADHMPDALRYWLEGYSQQIAWAKANGITNDDEAQQIRRAASTRTAISPMVQSEWDQAAPYYNNCPTVDDAHCVTGCVATAMAQVMYYHKYPTVSTTTIPGYTTSTKKIALDGLGSTTFSWSDMTDTYTSSTTGTSADAVAKLMQYCGWSVQMDYNLGSNNGSSAYNASVAEALKTYFGYDGGVTYAQRKHYTYQQWLDLLYNELAENRPVVLGGQSTGGGHSFVCDGYDYDDYFHINWGWGGSSDGYFRLSVLCPMVQGLGGSSSRDGFSYSQEAVIGIKPNNGSAEKCLTLEVMQFDANGSTTTQVVNRDNAESAFVISSLYFRLCSYRLGTNAFDYALQLTDATGNVQATLYEADNQDMTFNTDAIVTLSNVSTSKGLSDGTYYIKAVSCAHGSSTWLDCHDGEVQQLTAVVSGNTLTLTAPVVSGSATVPTAVTFATSSSPTVGSEVTVTAKVTGGSIAYNGNLFLRVNNTAVMGKMVEIPAGKTVDVTFSYTPSASGDNILTLWTAKSGGTQISGAETISVAGQNATDDLELTVSAVINNQSTTGKLYCNALKATVTVNNASTEKGYSGKLYCLVYQWTKTDNGDNTYTWNGESQDLYSKNLTVDVNSNKQFTINIKGLTTGAFYSFLFSYLKNGGQQEVLHLGNPGEGGPLEVTNGYTLGDAAGNVTLHEASTSIDAGSACFVDMRTLDTPQNITVTASSNPNCLYLLAEGASAPTSLEGNNVVCGETATTLSLTDGYDFYTPIAFTATTASYTRTFTQPATGAGGWTTILLPFSVSTVTVNNSRTATWFKSDSDTDGSFWLRQFTADGEGTVTFAHAQTLDANTPYIIAVPGDTWGSAWQMTGYPVTFSATSAAISNSSNGNSISGDYYRFSGSKVATSVTDCYVLDNAGEKFVKTTGSMPAFRAWFEAVDISSLTLPALTIASPDVTAIKTLPTTRNDKVDNSAIYSLTGQRVTDAKKGVYIVGGKKVVMK